MNSIITHLNSSGLQSGWFIHVDEIHITNWNTTTQFVKLLDHAVPCYIYLNQFEANELLVKWLSSSSKYYVTLHVQGDHEFPIRLRNSSCGACMWIYLRNQLVTSTTASIATSIITFVVSTGTWWSWKVFMDARKYQNFDRNPSKRMGMARTN